MLEFKESLFVLGKGYAEPIALEGGTTQSATSSVLPHLFYSICYYSFYTFSLLFILISNLRYLVFYYLSNSSYHLYSISLLYLLCFTQSALLTLHFVHIPISSPEDQGDVLPARRRVLRRRPKAWTVRPYSGTYAVG